MLRRPVESALAALIGMQNDPASATLRQRHIERTQHQFRVQMIGHRPAYNTAAEHIEHDGQIQESLAGRKWSKRQGVVELFPCLSSPNRTCTSQRIRLSVQALLIAKATSA